MTASGSAPPPRPLARDRVVVVLVTLALRLPYVLHHNLYSDELVPGVVALHALAERRPILENFGRPGNAGELVQAYLALPFFALAGADERWLGLATLAVTVAATLLFHHLATRSFGAGAAWIATLAMAFPPPELWRATVWVNTHGVGIALGLALIAASASLAARRERRLASAALLGAALPVCGWLNPMSLVIAAPALPGALGPREVAWRRLAAAAAALAVAALVTRPLWQATLAFVTSPRADAPSGGGLTDGVTRLAATFTTGLASGLGFADELPRAGRAADLGLAAALALAYLALVARALRDRTAAGGARDGLARAVAIVPPLVGIAIALSSREGTKYWLYALPFLFLAWGDGLSRLPRAVALPLAAAPVLLGAFASAGTIDAVHDDVVARLVAHLRERGVERVHADDALKWPLTFVSGEAIVAAGELPSRYPAHERAVFATPAVTVVLATTSPIRDAVEAALASANARYSTEDLADFVILSGFDRDVRCALRDVYAANAALYPPGLCAPPLHEPR